MSLTIARVREIVREELAKGSDAGAAAKPITKPAPPGTQLVPGMILEGIHRATGRKDIFVMLAIPAYTMNNSIQIKCLTRDTIGWDYQGKGGYNNVDRSVTDKTLSTGGHSGTQVTTEFSSYNYTIIFDIKKAEAK